MRQQFKNEFMNCIFYVMISLKFSEACIEKSMFSGEMLIRSEHNKKIINNSFYFKGNEIKTGQWDDVRKEVTCFSF